MSEQGPNGWPKPNLLKSTLEIIFVTTTIPILIVGITIFPFYGIYIEVWAMIHLAIIFMVVSIIRSYLWSKYVFKYGENR